MFIESTKVEWENKKKLITHQRELKKINGTLPRCDSNYSTFQKYYQIREISRRVASQSKEQSILSGNKLLFLKINELSNVYA